MKITCKSRVCGFALGLIVLGLQSCAPSSDLPTLPDFLPDKEVQIVSLTREGLDYMKSSRFVDAEFKFRQAAYLAPQLLNIRENLALALERQGNWEDAEDLYLKLIADAPLSISRNALLAKLYADKADFESARTIYLKNLSLAIEKGDQAASASMARSLAVIAFTIGDEEEALCYSHLAYQFNPTRLELIRHAKLSNGLGLYSLTQETIHRYFSATANSRDGELLHQIALAELGMGNLKEGAELERSVTLLAQSVPDLASEVMLIRSFLDLVLNGEKALREDETMEEVESKLVTQYKLRFAGVGASALLYWPSSLIDSFLALQEKVEAHDSE